ncbi:uncharacterized protein LOC106130523 [Amyelois transitella]|uniref:uncharacterized protein LOC106130523 n=1 Tax=Amyelois transitella TaxID=680683 RepID=UPI00067E4577|nr:uncharacterized protein LOC106130523 [Amyelois transitella]
MARNLKNDLEDLVDPLSILRHKLTVSPDSVGSSHWIEVTHVNNPNSFYVRQTAYDEYLDDLQAAGAKADKKDLFLGNVLIFDSKTQEDYIRGQIIFIDEENTDLTVEMFAMDYGFIEREVPPKKIYKPKNTNSIPSLVKHCQLELCKPIGGIWKEDAIDAMKFYVGDERTKIIVRDKTDDLLTVTMFNSCPEDISTMLALMGYSTFGYDGSSINRFSAAPAPKQAYYLYTELQEDDIIKVRVQSGKDLKEFYVADINNFKKYVEERENIAYFAAKADPMKPEDILEGKPVCVQTTKRFKYERALVKKITVPDSKALVQLVDWGDLIEVPFDSIKPMRESFLLLPAVAIYCTAVEKQLSDNALHKFLYPGYCFGITVKTVGDSFTTPHVVSITDLKKTKKPR